MIEIANIKLKLIVKAKDIKNVNDLAPKLYRKHNAESLVSAFSLLNDAKLTGTDIYKIKSVQNRRKIPLFVYL